MSRPPRNARFSVALTAQLSNNVVSMRSASGIRVTTRRPPAAAAAACEARQQYHLARVLRRRLLVGPENHRSRPGRFHPCRSGVRPVRRRREQCHQALPSRLFAFLRAPSNEDRGAHHHRSAAAGHHIGVLPGDDEAVRRSRGANRRTDTEGGRCGIAAAAPLSMSTQRVYVGHLSQRISSPAGAPVRCHSAYSAIPPALPVSGTNEKGAIHRPERT